MKTDIKILKLLISRKKERFTIRQISKHLKINYRIAYDNILLLEKEELIKITVVGNSKLCEFAEHFNSKVFEAEYSRKEDLFKNKNFLVLHNRLFELKFPFIALLFGSHVKGTANRLSDIDILTIGGNEKELRSAISLLPDDIHLTSVTYDGFDHMAKSKEFTVVSETISNNIILIGIEEYYRVLKNAR